MNKKRIIIKFRNQGRELTIDSLNRGVRIIINIHKTLSSQGNEANIHIFNLSRDTSSFIGQFGNEAEIQAGYDSDMSTIYIGAVRMSATRRSGADIITDIAAVTGFKTDATLYSGSFNQGTELNQIVKNIAKKMNLKVIDSNINVKGSVGFRGLSKVGTCKTVLDELAKVYGFAWSNQDGAMLALDDNLYLPSDYEMSHSSIISVNQEQQTGKENGQGVRIKTILNPVLRIGNGFRFNSSLNPNVSGNIYKCYNIVHSGDTGSSLWTTEVTGFTAGFSYFRKKKGKNINIL